MKRRFCRRVLGALAIIVFVSFGLCFTGALQQLHPTFDTLAPTAITAQQVAFGVPTWASVDEPVPSPYMLAPRIPATGPAPYYY